MTQSKQPVKNDHNELVQQIEPIVEKWCEQYEWEDSQTKALLKSLKDMGPEDYLNPDGIFTPLHLLRGADAKFPSDFYGENNKAIVAVGEGCTPTTSIGINETFIPTFKIANAISIPADYLHDKRRDVILRSIKIFMNGFARKIQDDKLHLLLQGANTRQPEGPLSNLKNLVKDFAGRGLSLTHLVISRNAMEILKKESEAGSLAKYPKMSEITDETIPTLTGINEMYGINLIVLDEVTNYFYDVLNFQARGKRWYHKLYRWMLNRLGLVKVQKDIMLGIDMTKNAAFVQPVRDKILIFDDPTLGRSLKVGIYGFMENGYGVLDSEPLGLAYFPFSR